MGDSRSLEVGGREVVVSNPDKVIFADSLPHTATGKLLKTALRTQYADVELSS